jgi:dethiobiotin synthetase
MNGAVAALGCFVAGTDTEVGKTAVSAALLHLLGADGSRTAGCKPVAAGTVTRNGLSFNEDVRALRDASSLDLLDAEVGPCQLTMACAPHIAAEVEGRSIDREGLRRAVGSLARRAEWLVVEGVGGFRVPLGRDWDTADLARDLGLPVILVIGLRLGCLNHAILTADAIAGCGLKLAGWIANAVDAAMPHREANVAALIKRLAAPCLGVVPRLALSTPSAVAAHLDFTASRACLHPMPSPGVA